MIRKRIIEIEIEDLDENIGEESLDEIFNKDLEINMKTQMIELDYNISFISVRNKEDEK